MKTRNEFGQYLNELNLIGDGVEVGVFHAAFSVILLSTWKGRLYMVDTWDVLPGYGAGIFDKAFWLALRDSCAKRVEEFGNRAVMMQMTSLKAAQAFQDGSLDFIYIDADHSFDSVVTDLTAWYPKLKRGGLFAGHDYFLRQKGDYMVKRAVDSFAKAQNAKVNITATDGSLTSWYWLKP